MFHTSRIRRFKAKLFFRATFCKRTPNGDDGVRVTNWSETGRSPICGMGSRRSLIHLGTELRRSQNISETASRSSRNINGLEPGSPKVYQSNVNLLATSSASLGIKNRSLPDICKTTTPTIVITEDGSTDVHRSPTSNGTRVTTTVATVHNTENKVSTTVIWTDSAEVLMATTQV